MEAIQIAISDAAYATALREMLVRDGTWDVRSAASPDPGFSGVMVLDCENLDRLVRPVANPERIVLITQNRPECLSKAWEAGIVSVVFDKDPLSMAMLAIMAARLRLTKTGRNCSREKGSEELHAVEPAPENH